MTLKIIDNQCGQLS